MYGKPDSIVTDAILLVVGYAAMLALICVVSGCAELSGGSSRHETGKTHITGGQERRFQGVTRISVGTDGQTTIEQIAQTAASTQPSTETQHDNAATTQPSGKNLPAGTKLNFTGGGDIGGLSFESLESGVKQSWTLALLFAAIGAGLWFVAGQRLAAVASWAGAVLALIYPQALAIAAVGIVGYVFYVYRKQIFQLAKGTEELIANNIDPAEHDVAKKDLQAAQDTDTKRAFQAVKAQL